MGGEVYGGEGEGGDRGTGGGGWGGEGVEVIREEWEEGRVG